MKLSKIIEELTELKEYIGDKDLKECTVNDWTRTSLEGENMESQLKTTMSDPDDVVEANYNGDGNVMSVGENSQNKMVWHPYKDCGDAPNVAEYQKDVFLCKVQMYHSDNDEPVGTPVYKVLLCDDGGVFYGFSKNDGDCYNKVIAWTEIIE